MKVSELKRIIREVIEESKKVTEESQYASYEFSDRPDIFELEVPGNGDLDLMQVEDYGETLSFRFTYYIEKYEQSGSLRIVHNKADETLQGYATSDDGDEEVERGLEDTWAKSMGASYKMVNFAKQVESLL